jgi:tRNA pseudouridine13 synthase
MIGPPPADMAAGLEAYASQSPRCRASIKVASGDFGVEELVGLAGLRQGPGPGLLPVYRVEKDGVDTYHMVEELSSALKSRVVYAGLKDKRAKAVQHVMPASARGESPSVVVGSKFVARVVGYAERGTLRGVASGNRFTVVLRECCQEIGPRLAEAFRLCEELRVPNYFGLQRFGSGGAATHLVGKAIVRGSLDEAVAELLVRPRRRDGGAAAEARRLMEGGRYGEGAALLPPGQDVEIRVAKSLAEYPADPARALRRVPIGLRRLYVQAYQSYIFNRTMSKAVMEGLDISSARSGDNWADRTGDGLNAGRPRGVKEAPSGDATPIVQLVGYAFRDYGSRFDRCTLAVLEEEGVSARDFFVKQLQEVSAEGGFRQAHMAGADMGWRTDRDAAHASFSLGRGQYATVLLREAVKPEDPEGSGFG